MRQTAWPTPRFPQCKTPTRGAAVATTSTIHLVYSFQHPMMKLRQLLFLGLTCLSITSSALGWGGEGHRLVAYIAGQRLNPQAEAAVKDLLGNATLVDVATWA